MTTFPLREAAPPEIADKMADARIALADLLLGQGRTEEAIRLYREVAEDDPDAHVAWWRLGLTLGSLDRPAEASVAFARAVAGAPDDPELRLDHARACFAAGNLESAQGAFEAILERWPGHPDAARGLVETVVLAANGLSRAGRPSAARAVVAPITVAHPEFATGWESLGFALLEEGRTGEASEAFETALRLDGALLVAALGLARCRRAAADFAGAIRLLEDLARRLPDSADIARELAHAYEHQGRFEEAAELLERCVESDPEDGAAWTILAMCRAKFGDAEATREAAARALALKSDNHVARVILARVEFAGRDWGRAMALLEPIAGVIEPDPELMITAASLYEAMRRQDRAMPLLRRVLELDPTDRFANSRLFDITLALCDWRDHDSFTGKLAHGIVADVAAARPIALDVFNLQALALDYATIAGAARGSARAIAEESLRDQPPPPAPPMPATVRDSRTRLGYLLPYTQLHSLPLVLKEIVANHPRARFEVLGYGTQPCNGSEFSRDYRAAFDRFTDLPASRPEAAATTIARDGIDLLIDVAGLTAVNCMPILAWRPAPVQAHAFGYSITTGADYVDYLISDPIYIPPRDAALGPEALVYLPETFMPTLRAPVADQPLRRAALGLPEEGVVLANFNHTCKFEPVIFAVWMGLLREFGDAVLWLGDWLPAARANLRREAAARGVAPERLVFAAIVEHDQHLARLALADIAVDNRLHGGGITTVDALWVGLPVVTIEGETPSARLGATLLTAAGAPELITRSLDDYVALIGELARDPARRAALREKLIQARDSAPLFDTGRFRGHLETGYEMMVARARRGLAPATIEVPAAPR